MEAFLHQLLILVLILMAKQALLICFSMPVKFNSYEKLCIEFNKPLIVVAFNSQISLHNNTPSLPINYFNENGDSSKNEIILCL